MSCLKVDRLFKQLLFHVAKHKPHLQRKIVQCRCGCFLWNMLRYLKMVSLPLGAKDCMFFHTMAFTVSVLSSFATGIVM